MAAGPSSQVLQPSRRKIKRPGAPSPRWAAFLMGWFVSWPILIFAYEPLAAPYDPLTLILVVPGGAIWLVAFGLGFDALAKMAIARWPVAKTILEILGVLVFLLILTICCLP